MNQTSIIMIFTLAVSSLLLALAGYDTFAVVTGIAAIGCWFFWIGGV